MEALGLLAEGAPLADWRLQVDGEDVAPAQLEAALTQADPAQEETPTEEEPAEETETPAQLDDGGQGAFVVQVYDVKNAPCSPTGRTAGPRPSGSRARMR